MSSASALAGAGVTGREAEVLALLGEHLSHAEIAGRLFISIRTVESHVASLRRKLGVGTHRELVRLAAGHRAAGAGAGPLAPARLPSPLTSFIGRESEKAALAAALDTSRLVSAVGPGGTGKTRLALAVAAAEARRFADGTWYVDLVPVTDPALVPGTVLAALGPGETSARPAQEVLAAAVGDRRALLVLDNCEHLVNAVAVLTERLLSACPNLTVLLTSRVRLVVPHEAVYAVPGLSMPAPGEAGGDAVTLFAERAAAAGAPLPDGASRQRAAGICQALGGLPLAIELAAARLPSLGLDGLEAGLADQLKLLAGGSRQQPRHRSLYDTLDWSYRLLDPAEQAVLRRVAVFAAPFGPAAAAAVAGFGALEPPDVSAALGRLAEHSLLVPVTGARGIRYHALEPVRQFAMALLDADADAGRQARSRHLAWCLDTAADLDGADPAGPAWPRDLDTAADEFRAALGWAAGQAGPEPGARAGAYRLAAAFSGLLFARGRLREAQQRYEQAAVLAADPVSAGPAAAAVALERAAAVAKIRTMGNEGLRLDQAAAAAYLQAGDRTAASVAFARCAEHIERFAGMLAGRPAAGTARLLAEARDRAGGDPRAAAAVSLAEAQAQGASPPAAGAAGRAVSLARQSGDPLLISAALDAATGGLMTQGDICGAAELAVERIGVLPALGRDPRAALELKDALHTAIFTGLAAGQVARSLGLAEQHYSLPFLREEPDLGGDDLLAPAALAGQGDRVIALGEQWRQGWERAGRPVAPGRSLAPAALALVHGLRGDDASRTAWLEVLAAVRGVAREQAVPGSGCGEVFEAIVLLDRGQPRAALRLLAAAGETRNSWSRQLWSQWISALRAEAAVLAGDPGADGHLATARGAASRNPVALALTRRAEALARADAAAVRATAAGFARAGYPHQETRAFLLAGPPSRD